MLVVLLEVRKKEGLNYSPAGSCKQVAGIDEPAHLWMINKMTDRLAYRVPEVCKMLGISRATFYRRVTSGELSVKKLGGVSLVTRESLERWVGETGEVES